jgi:hypothetical protein
MSTTTPRNPALERPDYLLTRPDTTGFTFDMNRAAEAAYRQNLITQLEIARADAAYVGCRIAAALIAQPWAESFSFEFHVNRSVGDQSQFFQTYVDPTSIVYVPGSEPPAPRDAAHAGPAHGRGSWLLQKEVADDHLFEALRNVAIRVAQASRTKIGDMLSSCETLSGWAIFSRLYPDVATQMDVSLTSLITEPGRGGTAA